MFTSSKGRLRYFVKISFTFCKAPSSTTSLPPKYLQSNGLVMSSAVGPSPPVIKIISACLLSSSNVFHISSQTSPTATRRFTQMPSLFSCCPIHALFVSMVCPINNSSPIVIIEAFIFLSVIVFIFNFIRNKNLFQRLTHLPYPYY